MKNASCLRAALAGFALLLSGVATCGAGTCIFGLQAQ